jgi:BON domain
MLSHLSRLLRSSRLRLLAGASGLALLGATGALLAGDPIPVEVPAKPQAAGAEKGPAISDITIARAVLAAIDADPVLKDVNLIVSVVDHGAVIGGPVNSDEVKTRAEVVVRGVAGIESVKNVCFVQPDPDPLLRAIAERMKPGAKSTGSAALPGIALAPTAPEGFLPPLSPQPPSDLVVSANDPNRVVVQRPTIPAGPAVGILGAPVSPNASTAKQPPANTPGALTGTTTAKPADIQAIAATLRKNDVRFARLVVEVKPDGGLFVTGRGAKAADAWDFARELGRIPGVTRVAVDPELVK